MNKILLLFTEASHLLNIGTSFGTDHLLLLAVLTPSKFQQPEELSSLESILTGSYILLNEIQKPSMFDLLNKDGSISVLFLIIVSKMFLENEDNFYYYLLLVRNG